MNESRPRLPVIVGEEPPWLFKVIVRALELLSLALVVEAQYVFSTWQPGGTQLFDFAPGRAFTLAGWGTALSVVTIFLRLALPVKSVWAFFEVLVLVTLALWFPAKLVLLLID